MLKFVITTSTTATTGVTSILNASSIKYSVTILIVQVASDHNPTCTLTLGLDRGASPCKAWSVPATTLVPNLAGSREATPPTSLRARSGRTTSASNTNATASTPSPSTIKGPRLNSPGRVTNGKLIPSNSKRVSTSSTFSTSI